MTASLLRELEEKLGGEDAVEELATALVVLAAVAGRGVSLSEDEVHGPARRALLLLAAGGDPDRGLDLNGRAVQAFAQDIRTSDRQLTLERGVEDLQAQVGRAGLPHVEKALKALRATPDVAWRAFACALLAEELAGESY